MLIMSKYYVHVWHRKNNTVAIFQIRQRKGKSKHHRYVGYIKRVTIVSTAKSIPSSSWMTSHSCWECRLVTSAVHRPTKANASAPSPALVRFVRFLTKKVLSTQNTLLLWCQTSLRVWYSLRSTKYIVEVLVQSIGTSELERSRHLFYQILVKVD